MRKNPFVATFLAILITSLALPTLALPTPAQPTQATMGEEYGWKTIQTDVITVRFPADGRKPTFLWWYTKKPEIVYVVKYQGLMEYFTFLGLHYKGRYRALAENLYELFIKPKEMGYEKAGKKVELRHLRNVTKEIYGGWGHPPHLPFDGCRWELTDVRNYTDPKDPSKVIGLAFAFKLVNVNIPWFKFAENNIMIRCRFYYAPVNETVGNLYNYSVTAGEMKMDFVVNDWKWNIDIIKPLLSDLQEHGIAIPEGMSGLALWVNLASINATEIEEAEEEPEEIEHMSITSHIMIEGERVFVKYNKTETEDEKPIVIKKRPDEQFKLQFATEDETLAGFFRFIASAKVTNSTGGVDVVPVRASYIEAGAHMRLFICYPYFNDGALEHDPSIGVEVPETTTPEATTPQYTIEAPSGSEVMPKVSGGITLPIVTPEFVIALVAVVSTIAIAIFIAKWKGKVVNVIGIK